jgi:cytochrome c2
MRNISLIFKQFSRSVLLLAGLALLTTSVRAQDAAKGEALFKQKCTSCHNGDLVTRMTGPGLGPIVSSETDDKWLSHWIKNNQELIKANDPKAMKIYNEFNQAGMTVFADLPDGDIANVIKYIRDEYKKPKPPVNPTTSGEDSGPSQLVIWGLIGVIVIAFIVILVLNKVIGSLERLVLARKDLPVEAITEEVDVEAEKRKATIKKLLKNKKLVGFFVVCAVIAGGTWQWVTLWNTNVHTGYQPVQPIKYSHELHAGIMKIDCQYCHSGAYKSKNASIPSLNVCMNCHKTVKTTSPEIAKIYTALGYDPATQKYDSTKARPIQWVRVHNLPDFAYFNHSQHVVVGKVKCQTCHGPIETMKEVYQYSPLTMKWCIQCHKRTEVDFTHDGKKGNEYYDNMVQVHEKIKRGEKVTEASMGGLECGKCHY